MSSNASISNAEIEALLKELDRGPTDSVAASADGIRPLGGTQTPAEDEVILPRGVWGTADVAELLARSAEALRSAQRRIIDLESRIAELDLTVGSSDHDVSSLSEPVDLRMHHVADEGEVGGDA